MRVLVVEDERRLAMLLRRVLEEESYAVEVAYDGLSGEQLARDPSLRAVVLDVMLPGQDGLTTCRNLRRDGVGVPILMLTARDALEDRVRGLDSGADDYLVKPFALAELLARLRAITRRGPGQAPPEKSLSLDGLVMDLPRHEVRRDGRLTSLTPREFALLEYFLRHPGQVLTRDQLLAGVWGYDADVTSNVVDIYVHYLRDKIDNGGGTRLLRTVRGIGYTLRTD